MGAWRRGRGRAPLAGVPRSGLRWTQGIWSVVAWGGRALAVPWVAGGLVGAGPWLPVGVGWPGGCRSRLPSSGLERTPCQGKRGGACCGAVYDRVGDACGWWRARSAVLFPAGPDLGGGGVGDVGGEGGVGAGVDDCVGGGAVGEGGMGVRVDEAGAGLWLMVVSWWVSCCRCRRRRWCWCL